jgi:hypothetical protein
MQQSKKHLLLIFVVILTIVYALVATAAITATPAGSQIAKGATLLWEKNFGGTGDDRAFYAAKAGDGYVVVGSSTSFEEGKTVACIVRFDSQGNQLWNRTFLENFGLEFRYVCCVPGGFYLMGNTFYATGKVEGFVLKTDAQGVPLWNITLKAAEGVNKLFSGTTDGNSIIVAGLTQSQGNTNNAQAWLAKLDTDGNIIWNRTYGDSAETAARAVTLTQDNCYVVAGYVDSNGMGNYDFLAMKISTDGNLLWNKTYGGLQSDKAYTITSAANGYVVAGDTRSKGAGDCDAWIVKIDLAGNLVWDKTVGGSSFDSPTHIIASPNGGYLVAGTTFSFGNGQRDFWLFKVSDAGEIVWSSTVGRSEYEEAYAVVYAGNNDYFLAGWTNSIGNGGRYDFYVVKVHPTNNGQ